MKNISYLSCFIIAVCFYSCKQRTENILLNNISLLTGFEVAEKADKGLILISNKAGCAICENFEVDLMKDESYASKIYKDFVILRVDDNVIGGRWLSRILNFSGYPAFLFFDRNRKLIGVEVGGIEKKQMVQLLSKVERNEPWVDQYYEPGGKEGLPKEKVISYIGNTIEGQYNWENYIKNRSTEGLKKMEIPLRQSISNYSTFYNNYLLTKYYAANKELVSAKKYAINALKIENPVSLYFNPDLRTEMKMILDSNYTVYNEAYIGMDNIEINLGKLKFGGIKVASFTVKNIGKKNLVFRKLQTDCECTVADYPKIPIKPGCNGTINVSFNAKRSGEFTHMIQIAANASNAPITLTIKGLVLGD